jgi:hypothetical protein
MRNVLLLGIALTTAVACGKKKDTGGDNADPKAAKAVDLPALTAEPAVGDITPAEKPPFESVKFRQLAKRGAKGWPKYEAYNLGMKPIKFMAIYGYAYDAGGTQVARTAVPLSWNGNIESGKKSDWDIEIGGMDDLPATAAAFEVCFDSIKFGDEQAADDRARCPEKKAKGK